MKKKGLGFLPQGTSSLPVSINWDREHVSIRPAKCPDHPRAGRAAFSTMRRLTISCGACSRTLLVVSGPFRSIGAM